MAGVTLSSGVDPSTIPAGTPPSGTSPNFIDPSTLEEATTAMCVVMTVLVTIAVAGRLYSNARVTRSIGLEDYFCVLAMVNIIVGTRKSAQLLIFGQTDFAVRLRWVSAVLWVESQCAAQATVQS